MRALGDLAAEAAGGAGPRTSLQAGVLGEIRFEIRER
jgi:hypothetical protein